MAKDYGKIFGRSIAWTLVVFLGVLLALPVFGKDTSDSSKELARLIYTGQFKEAEKALVTQPEYSAKSSVSPLIAHLRKFGEISARRETLRLQTYEENVREAKACLARATTQPTATRPAVSPQSQKATSSAPAKSSAVEKSFSQTDLEKALTAARKAMFYAKEPKKFGQLDWVRKIADEAKVLANRYLQQHEWLKAGNVYAELATIYEDDKTYDKLTRDCAMRVRFEATYKPKSDWQEETKNITIDVVPESSVQVSTYYVEKPDFAKMASSALQNMRVMTEIPKLGQVFPALADAKKTEAFDRELKKLGEQIKDQAKKKNFSTRDFWQVFVKLMVVNGDTVALPENVIIKEFVDSAFTELDPFTNVIWPSEMQDFDKHTMGRFSGVGIQISKEDNKLKVVTPIPGSPAFQAGIVPGDIIVTINGEKAEELSIDQAVKKITGPKGTRVKLGIYHPWTDKTTEFNLIRDTIIIQTVKGVKLDKDNKWSYFIDPERRIAYIRLTQFTDSTPAELTDALKKISRDGGKGLILDMRFNPGGTLKAAWETVDLFVTKGTIVSTRGRTVPNWKESASNRGNKFVDLPMIVLINKYSASAAEIVAGALKDYHRAWIVGERSFGKGSVQNVISLVNDTCRLKITTAHYYLPSGKCIHRKPDSKEWGVDPNLTIELTPNEVRDEIDIQRDAEIVTQVNGHKVDTRPATRPAATAVPRSNPDDSDEIESDTQKPRKYPPVDIQLDAAIAVMQARLAWNVGWDQIDRPQVTSDNSSLAENHETDSK